MLLRVSPTVAVLAIAAPAFADDRVPDHAVTPVDLPIIVGALAASVAPLAIPIRAHHAWDTELLGEVDVGTRANFSPRAAAISDVTLGLTIAAPIGYLTALGGSAIDDADGDRLVLYTETLAVDLALVQIAKYVVQRPRPYTYRADAAARAYTKQHGDDSYLSFYSGHAALAFGASVSGAYLLSASDKVGSTARGFVWGTGLASAAFTANLRVRAGKHFPSDVLIGALVGTAVGYAVPALHASTGKGYAMSGSDLGMGLAGIAAGIAISELVPLGHPRDDGEPPASLAGRVWSHVGGIGPMPVRGGGAGLALSGSL